MKRLLVFTAFVMLTLGGCTLFQETPEGQVIVSPDQIAKVDAIAMIAEPTGALVTSLSLLWPPAALLGGLIAGAVGAWRNMKPKLEKATSEAEIATSAGEATASAIEGFKVKYPEQWEELSEFLEKYHGESVENFYRAMRGLPLKT